MSGKKHYTEVEKKLLLEILKNMHTLLKKKSDVTKLKLKEETWNQITEEYNSSMVISMKRDIKQLKKNWSNLKSGRRDALTKEKQAVLATGGGPPIQPVEVDPDITLIAPHLMTTALTIFSSNISTQIIEDNMSKKRQQQIFNDEFIYEEDLVEEIQDFEDSAYSISGSKNQKELDRISNAITDVEEEETQDSSKEKTNTIKVNKNATPAMPRKKEYLLNLDAIVIPPKRKKANLSSSNKENADERSLKLERIRCLMGQERELAETKLAHEKLKQKMEIQYLKEKYELELRASAASAELAEYILREKTLN